MKRTLALIGLLLLVPLNLGDSCLPDYEFVFETLYVENADEDSWWSDGDEPYFVLIGFRMTPGTPGSANAFWSGYLEEEWADGIDTGDSESIPSKMGTVNFPDVDRLTLAEVMDTANPQTPELIGVIAFAMESDATPWSTVRQIFDGVVTGLENSLNAPPTGGGGSSGGTGDICAAANTIRSAVEDILGDFWVGVESWGDPDNVVDHHLFLFAAVTSDVEALIQTSGCWTTDPRVTFGSVRDYTWNVSSNPLVFNDSSEGVTYHVGGGFRLLMPTP